MAHTKTIPEIIGKIFTFLFLTNDMRPFLIGKHSKRLFSWLMDIRNGVR
jgi:hypothetical protein